MFKNKNGICDDVLYIKRMYNTPWWSGCDVLAYNSKYRFIKNPFGGVDFYKVDRNDGNIIPMGRNLHKKTILRFLMKFDIKNSNWGIRYPKELGLPDRINIRGKIYEVYYSFSQLYYGSMAVVKS